MGLILAMVMRILLLFCINWLISLTAPLFDVMGNEISGKDMIMIGGGLFLLTKATFEIHEKLEAPEEGPPLELKSSSLSAVLFQILMLDLVFSLDSVITAVGMTSYFWVMVAAVIISVLVMLISVGTVSRFVKDHPTVKILALSFLLLIGVTLIAEGLDQHFSKGYIYFAMGFSVFVEIINLKIRGRSKPVTFKHPSFRPSEKKEKRPPL